jgi:hypothetical protein
MLSRRPLADKSPRKHRNKLCFHSWCARLPTAMRLRCGGGGESTSGEGVRQACNTTLRRQPFAKKKMTLADHLITPRLIEICYELNNYPGISSTPNAKFISNLQCAEVVYHRDHPTLTFSTTCPIRQVLYQLSIAVLLAQFVSRQQCPGVYSPGSPTLFKRKTNHTRYLPAKLHRARMFPSNAR